MSVKQDLTKEKFFMLQPIERISGSRNGHVYYKCLCDCGKECVVAHCHLKKSTQKSCGCLLKKQKGRNHVQWKGHEEISGGWWRDHIVSSANGAKGRRKLELNVTIEDVWDLYIKQNKLCALTGVPISIKSSGIYNTASLDRIDSSIGYTLSNIQWVHKHVNIMKNKFEQKYFIELCQLVASASKRNETT
jgi:hypothetical protein